MKVSLISAVNNDGILKSCLLNSPDSSRAEEVLLQRGFDRASVAYNEAIQKAKGDVLIFLHQDMYLPEGWLQNVETHIARLTESDPNWGVLGIYGVNPQGQRFGYLYCSANRCLLGRPVEQPGEAVTLDEIVLIIRRNSDLRFDEKMKGFHFYGSDLCLTARQKGLKSYVIPGFCIHNANEYGMFPASFWKGYIYMRRKWTAQLPVRTPCIDIERSLRPVLLGTVWRYCWLKKHRKKLALRLDDPASFHRQLVDEGRLAPSFSSQALNTI